MQLFARSFAPSGAVVRFAPWVGMATLLVVGSESAGGPQTSIWLNPADGAWQDGSNWSTESPPGPLDSALFNAAGVYSVFLQDNAAASAVTASAGMLTLDLNSFSLALGAASNSLLVRNSGAPRTILGITDGALQTGGARVGAFAGGGATTRAILMIGSNATWTLGGPLFVGDFGAVGVVQVNGGGVVQSGPATVRAGSSIEMYGGSWTLQSLTANSKLRLEQGASMTATTAALNGPFTDGVRIFDDGTSLEALTSLTIGTDVQVGLGARVDSPVTNVSGIVRVANPGTVFHGGNLTLNPGSPGGRFLLSDHASAFFGDITVGAGADLLVSGNATLVQTGNVITDPTTILELDGPNTVWTVGSLNAQGGVSVSNGASLLITASGVIGGTTTVAGAGSRIEAGGGLTTNHLLVDDGGRFTAGGPVMISGNAAALAGSRLESGGEMRLLAPSAALDVGGGSLVASSTLRLGAGTTLTANQLTVGAQPPVGPGAPTGLYTGSLRIDATGAAPNVGQLTLTQQSSVTVQLSGATSGGVIDATAASLGGTLRVSLAPGFLPQVGQRWTILTGAPVLGTFGVVVTPGFPDARIIEVEYRASTIELVVTTLDDLIDFEEEEEFQLPLAGGPTGVSTGDFDSDGSLDLAISVNAGETSPGRVVILLNGGNDGGGGWNGYAAAVQVTVGQAPSSVASGDFDGDGDTDFAVVNSADNTMQVFFNDTTLLGPGGLPGFGAPLTLPTGTAPSSINATDVTEDGALDLVVVNAGDSTVVVYGNDGMGGYAQTSESNTGDGGSDSADPADVDNDKCIDIVVTDISLGPGGGGRVLVLINLGGGVFDEPLAFETGAAPADIVTADFDLDGNIDVATANSGADTVSVLLNLGGGMLAPRQDIVVGVEPVSLTVLDIENDGDPDLAVVARDESNNRAVFIVRNDGSSNGELVVSILDPVAVGANPVLVTAGDVDGSGLQDIIAVSASQVGAPVGPPLPGAVTVLLNESVPIAAGDLDGSGQVNGTDLARLLADWGACPLFSECRSDLTGDLIVNGQDLAVLLANWSPLN